MRQTVLGQALTQKGLFYFRLGDHSQAEEHLGESIRLLRTAGAAPALLVDPLVINRIILQLTGEIDRAGALLEEGLAHAHAAGDTWYAAYALFNQGYIAGLMGRSEEGYQ